jgi:hypothetical protein
VKTFDQNDGNDAVLKDIRELIYLALKSNQFTRTVRAEVKEFEARRMLDK